MLSKQSGGSSGKEVVTHQDGCSSFTDPPSCVTLWYALQDNTVENGCLHVARGSHGTLPIVKRCVRAEDGRAQFVGPENPIHASVQEEGDPELPLRDKKGKLVLEPVEVIAGTMVVMHGNLAHGSEANVGARGRLAFNFAIVEGELERREDAYLQPGDSGSEFEKLRALVYRDSRFDVERRPGGFFCIDVHNQ